MLFRVIPCSWEWSRPAKAIVLLALVVAANCGKSWAVTVDECISQALASSPKLRSAQFEILARTSEVQQARRGPNPDLRINLENAGGTGPFAGLQASETTIEFAHLINSGGRRKSESQLHLLEKEQAVTDLLIQRNEIVRIVRQAFAEARAAQELSDLAQAFLNEARLAFTSVEERARIGGAPEAEKIRAALAVDEATLRRDLSLHVQENAKERLRVLAGFPESDSSFALPSSTPNDFLAATAPSSYKLGLERISTSPLFQAEQRAWQVAEGALQVQRASAAPLVELAGGVRHFGEGGEAAFLAGVTLPLPLFDRRKEAIQAAQHRIEGALSSREEVSLSLARELKRICDESQMAHAESDAFQRTLLPRAREALSAATRAFHQGLFRQTEVLEARQTLEDLSLRAVQARLRLAFLEADYDALLGHPRAAISISEVNHVAE